MVDVNKLAEFITSNFDLYRKEGGWPGSLQDALIAHFSEGMPSEDQKILVPLLNQFFGTSDIESLCFEMGIDDEQLRGLTKDELARSLVKFATKMEMVPKLRQHMMSARPNLRSRLS